jgi:hypothetical protein
VDGNRQPEYLGEAEDAPATPEIDGNRRMPDTDGNRKTPEADGNRAEPSGRGRWRRRRRWRGGQRKPASAPPPA